jgi:hypothetical protein|tara:strand:- start:221 stop:655 length:435 start_codon:yes stop_codon:yes gene_type:complete
MANFNKPLEIYEMLEKVSAAKTRAEKITMLRNYNHHALLDVMRGAFDDAVQWNLPEGKPPFQANVPESVPSSLLKQNQKFKYFVQGPLSESLTTVKREQIFVQVLESIHPADAEVVINMINKKSPGKGITKKLVQEAYPDLIRL